MPVNRLPRVLQAMAKLGLRLATDKDIAEGRALAERLVGPAIASLDVMLRVQARTGCTSFVMRSAEGRLIGALAVIPLSAGAGPSLARGDFDGLSPPDAVLAGPGDVAMAFYGWGMAGLTPRGRAAVIAAAMRLQREVYGDLPFYARAATSQGERVLHDRMGARAHAGGLVSAPPWRADDRPAPRKAA